MDKNFDLNGYIMHHVLNSHEWKLPFLPAIHLPEPLSLHALMVLFASVGLILLFTFGYNRKARVPSGITNALEVTVLFIRDEISIPALGKEDGIRLTPLFCTFFFFILALNLIGLIPHMATATSNFNVTCALAMITFIFMVFCAIYKNGLIKFFKAFLPSDVPILILPFIFLIELIGVLMKTGALMIRLFANMLAGHIVILSLLGLVVLMGFFALPSVVLAVFIYVLEVLVAVLQAYIFTLLSATFIGQTYHPHH